MDLENTTLNFSTGMLHHSTPTFSSSLLPDQSCPVSQKPRRTRKKTIKQFVFITQNEKASGVQAENKTPAPLSPQHGASPHFRLNINSLYIASLSPFPADRLKHKRDAIRDLKSFFLNCEPRGCCTTSLCSFHVIGSGRIPIY